MTARTGRAARRLRWLLPPLRFMLHGVTLVGFWAAGMYEPARYGWSPAGRPRRQADERVLWDQLEDVERLLPLFEQRSSDEHR
jgi:hypothetical protein